ncbi:hypothetical protein NUU61_004727 [Penicillium alfredii]|uniref:Nucleotide-diphospho-sugar transferase domain-containing protein n=1 Tax=Penicillium alfredii TaxID=1506179 RepID=A0A9W9K7J0_9EURO|nr:uncharacterized protein NUU61_004727 [Penicillium alfredii]KAJ5095371.1 hypothetical protein NUU61_004727 [Penicillium alfredii]
MAAMKDALKDYQFVVFMDADAIFTYSHLPIEWLLNHWEISDKTLIALAEDPSRNVHLDEDGQIELNTGFMIAQSSSRTLEMFEAWESCPDGTRYKDCSRWKKEWSHEQDAFSDYIRHDFNRPEDIKVITCKEGNRFPGNGQDESCEGSFVEHYWQAKDKLPWGVQQSIWQWLVPQLGESFRQHENALGMPKLAGLNQTGSEQTGSNSDGSDSSGWNNTGLNQTNDAGP